MSGRRLLPRAERQASIEQAAARAFGRTGYAATSMEDVAAEAGVTKVLVYRHVSSKEALYRSILEQVSADLAEEFAARAEEDVATAATRAHLNIARRRPDGYRLLFVHAPREPDFAAEVADIHRLMTTVADDSFGAGLPDPLRGWAADLVHQILVQAVLTWLEAGAVGDDDDFVARTAAGLVGFVAGILTPGD